MRNIIFEENSYRKMRLYEGTLYALVDTCILKYDISGKKTSFLCSLPKEFCRTDRGEVDFVISNDVIWILSFHADRLAMFDMKKNKLSIVVLSSNMPEDNRGVLAAYRDKIYIISMMEFGLYKLNYDGSFECYKEVTGQLMKKIHTLKLDFNRIRYGDYSFYNNDIVLNVSTSNRDMICIIDTANSLLKNTISIGDSDRYYGVAVCANGHVFFQRLGNGRSELVEWDLMNNEEVCTVDISYLTNERVFIRCFMDNVYVIFLDGRLFRYSIARKKFISIWENVSKWQQIDTICTDATMLTVYKEKACKIDVLTGKTEIVDFCPSSLEAFVLSI